MMTHNFAWILCSLQMGGYTLNVMGGYIPIDPSPA
jgi:hypothetical protein